MMYFIIKFGRGNLEPEPTKYNFSYGIALSGDTHDMSSCGGGLLSSKLLLMVLPLFSCGVLVFH